MKHPKVAAVSPTHPTPEPNSSTFFPINKLSPFSSVNN